MGLQVWPNRMSDLAVQYVPRKLKRVDTPALDEKQGKILNRRTNMVTIPIWSNLHWSVYLTYTVLEP